ncbi:MAG: DNA recombination protein RmuC, partial [Bacteroidetes bacterium]|nr:DNA recombination protein RmuC [Bacteroidota bacterium]
DFGIMFLPIEGLFAEVVRQPDLVALLQRDFKIIVTGPTTLAAMLNSLQMGFKTLAIQKRSSEVWDILGAVKTEFGKFGGVLDKAQKKLNEANRELDTLVGTRTRIMMSKLKKVEELPTSSANTILPDSLERNNEDMELE